MINISNHQSTNWKGKQANDAGEVLDIPFPSIPADPNFKLNTKAAEFWNSISDEVADHATRTGDRRIHIMGELGFTFRLVQIVHLAVYVPVHSVTDRVVAEDPQTGKRYSISEFNGFRWYYS